MKKRNSFPVLISLIVAIGGFLLGFDSAVISGAVPFVETYFDLTKIQLGWSVSCLLLGAMLGNVLSGPVSDKIGRKYTLIITSVLFTVSAISSALATNFIFFIVARMIGGLGIGAAILIAPIYIAEIAPPKKRGQLVSFNQLNIVIGISAAYFSNYLLLDIGENNWRWMLGVEAIPAILYFIFLFLVPRSPRWLILKRGHHDEAVKVLTKIGGKDHAEKEFQLIKNSVQGESSEQGRFKELFSRKMRLIMTIAIAIAVLQQITGINAILYYAPIIFEAAGGGRDASFLQATFVGLANLSFTILAIYLIDKLGRKPLLLFGTLGMAISLFVMSYASHIATYKISDATFEKLEHDKSVPEDIMKKFSRLKDTSYDTRHLFSQAVSKAIGAENFEQHKEALIKHSLLLNTVLVLIAILGYVGSFAMSIGPVMWALLSEIFPNRLRGVAISTAGLTNGTVSFLVTLVFPWEIDNIGTTGTFLIFGVFAALAFFFTLFYVPETKGKSLEELEKTLIKTD